MNILYKHMTNIFVLSLIILLAFTQSILAQTNSMRVMTARNSSFSGDGTDWKTLRCGVQLQDKDNVKVEPGGMIILVNSNGKTIELKSPGSFSVAKLSTQAKNSSGVAGKLAGYIMDELTSSNQKDDRYQQNMKFTGATSKMSNSKNKICLDSPNFTNVVGRNVNLAWKFCGESVKYDAQMEPQNTTQIMKETEPAIPINPSVILTITDSMGTKILEKTLEVNEMSIDVNTLEKGKLYKWSVCMKNKQHIQISDNSFRILNAIEANQIESEANTIRKELGESNAWTDIVTASLYEKNKIYNLALDKYRSGIKSDPSVPEYQLLYSKFLDRVGMVK